MPFGIGKLFAVVGENLSDRKRSLVDQAFEKAAGGGCRLVLYVTDTTTSTPGLSQ